MNIIDKIHYMYEMFYKIMNEFFTDTKNIIDTYGGFGNDS